MAGKCLATRRWLRDCFCPIHAPANEARREQARRHRESVEWLEGSGNARVASVVVVGHGVARTADFALSAAMAREAIEQATS